MGGRDRQNAVMRLVWVTATGLVACTASQPPMPDAGPPVDSGAPPPYDAGPFDAGESMLDGGPLPDAGTDAGPLDSGPPVLTAAPESTFSTDTVALKAKLVDGQGQPLPGIQVVLEGTSTSDGFDVLVTTNDAGVVEALLPNPSPGDWTFTAQTQLDGGAQTWTATATVLAAPTCAIDAGSETFATAAHVDLTTPPARLWVTDVNVDGFPDLLGADSAGDIDVALGAASGVDGGVAFATPTHVSFSTNPLTDVYSADFNGDGIPDLAVVQSMDGAVGIALGNGDGTFGMPTPYSTGSTPKRFASADLNNDGVLDFAVTDSGEDDITLLFGNGDGTFTSFNKRPLTGGAPNGIAAGDLTGDGVIDLAIANQGSGTVTIYLGSGSGTFTNPNATDPPAGAMPGPIATADLNGDGYGDLVVANLDGSSTVSVLLGDGTGAFAAPASATTGGPPVDLALADMNGDGKTDIVTLNTGGDSSLLLGKGDGTFQAPLGTPSPSPAAGSALHVADMNNDGLLDVVAACTDANAYALVAACPAGD